MSANYGVTVIFGRDQVKKYEYGESFSAEENELYVKRFEFASQLEMEAFRLGLEAGEGWMELEILDDEVVFTAQNLKNNIK